MATTGVYNRAKALLAQKQLGLDGSDDIRVLLVDSSFVFDPDHHFVADAVGGGGELAGPGYVRKILSSDTVTEDDATDRAKFDADDVTWAGADFGTVDGIVAFKFVSDDSDSPLICCLDLEPKITTNTGPYTAQFNLAGILRIL